jgi:hypothetical protein
MRSVIRPRVLYRGLRNGLFVSVLCLTSGLTVVSVPLVGSGTASGAVPGSKAKITTRDCSSTTCQITLTIKGIVKETPTGVVGFFLAGATAPLSGATCFDSPVILINGSSARATCVATGLPLGHHEITAKYSGDNNFDPSTTSKRIMVKSAPPS